MIFVLLYIIFMPDAPPWLANSSFLDFGILLGAKYLSTETYAADSTTNHFAPGHSNDREFIDEAANSRNPEL
jgi:hypothetical protein